MEMFSSFFSALQTFVSELTLSGSDSLRTIELGEYFVLITTIPEIMSDLVIIVDKADIKEAQKLIPQIMSIILSHQDLFVNWDQDPEKLEIFDLQVVQLILSNRKLISESSLTANQSSILKSIWDQKGVLSEQLRENLSKEMEKLNEDYLIEENYLNKYNISMKLIDISEKLRDDKKFIEYQTEAKSLKDEIKDRKLRLQFYLGRLKESLEYSKYAETYSYLYSLCMKLQNFAEPEIIEKYKTLTKTLLNRNEIPKEEFKKVLKEISMIEENIGQVFSLNP
ncbi:MAG: hypothetical protein ACFFB0_11905 [Promethearchaeota archaeon]